MSSSAQNGVSDGKDLLAIVDRVVAQAQPGEQLEAFVSRGGETEVRVYQGEVEHFVAAQAEGIGIRIIRDGQTGFAYAGTLQESAVAEVLAEARDNVQFGTHDEWLPTNSDDQSLTKSMMSYWVNFARYGDPNGKDLVAWPAFSSESDLNTLRLDTKIEVIDHPSASLCKALFD